jgi:hypothetical protein
MLISVIESVRWMVVIPVPIIMELDGLASNASQLGDAAQSAIAYVSSHIRSHSMLLKVQTSKGNYLSSLSIRTEQVDFQDEASQERNMDDLILHAAMLPAISIIHLDTIVCAAHLMGVYGKKYVPNNLTAEESLNAFRTYYVNKFIDHHAFKIAF